LGLPTLVHVTKNKNYFVIQRNLFGSRTVWDLCFRESLDHTEVYTHLVLFEVTYSTQITLLHFTCRISRRNFQTTSGNVWT